MASIKRHSMHESMDAYGRRNIKNPEPCAKHHMASIVYLRFLAYFRAWASTMKLYVLATLFYLKAIEFALFWGLKAALKTASPQICKIRQELIHLCGGPYVVEKRKGLLFSSTQMY